jgi:hypothetical protein
MQNHYQRAARRTVPNVVAWWHSPYIQRLGRINTYYREAGGAAPPEDVKSTLRAIAAAGAATAK